MPISSKLDRLEGMLNRMVLDFEKAKAEFLQAIESDSFRTLEWGIAFARPTAKCEMAKRYLRGIKAFRDDKSGNITEDEYFQRIVTDIINTVMNSASGRSRSSSVMTGLMSDELVSAHAALYNSLRTEGEIP